MHPFKAFISMYTEVSDEDWAEIEECLEYKVIQQNRILLKHGMVCQHLYFLENGSIRFFTSSELGENTIHLVSPPSLFTAAQSFSKQIPSDYGIQALEESYVWVLSRQSANRLFEVESWNNFLKNYFKK